MKLMRSEVDETEVAPPEALTAAGVPLARVNLLPPEIRDADRLRVIQASLVGGVVLATALVAVLAAAAAQGASDARAELLTAQGARAEMDRQVAELAPVRQVFADVERAETMVTAARASEVPWSRLLNDLSLVIPDGVWVETVAVSGPGGGTPAQADATASYGTVTYTGRGRSHDHVAAWLEALATQPGLADPTISTSALDADSLSEPTVTFSSTATVTEQALAPREEQP